MCTTLVPPIHVPWLCAHERSFAFHAMEFGSHASALASTISAASRSRVYNRALHTSPCIPRTVPRALNASHCTPRNVHLALYAPHCTPRIVHFAMPTPLSVRTFSRPKIGPQRLQILNRRETPSGGADGRLYIHIRKNSNLIIDCAFILLA